MSAIQDTADLRRDAIYLVGAGAQTALGATRLSTAAAVRAGLCAFTEHPYMRDKHGDAMIVAHASWLDLQTPMEERLAALAIETASEALSVLAGLDLRSKIRVHLALSAAATGDLSGAWRVAEALMDGLKSGPKEATRAPSAPSLGVPGPLSDEDPSLVLEGHAGGFLALHRAVDELRAGRASACLVGGVDSYLTVDLLEEIDYAGRLHSRHNSWGFTPGEGAGFFLMVTGAAAGALGLAPLAEIQAVATATEGKLLGTRTVNIGEGLSSAFRAVLTADEPVHHSYCDLNGETYRADELAFAMCRTSGEIADASFTAPATCWGDVGAASAPLAIVLAASTWSQGYAAFPVVLAWASSAHAPLRGAARIRRVTAPEDWRG